MSGQAPERLGCKREIEFKNTKRDACLQAAEKSWISVQNFKKNTHTYRKAVCMVDFEKPMQSLGRYVDEDKVSYVK